MKWAGGERMWWGGERMSCGGETKWCGGVTIWCDVESKRRRVWNRGTTLGVSGRRAETTHDQRVIAYGGCVPWKARAEGADLYGWY